MDDRKEKLTQIESDIEILNRRIQSNIDGVQAVYRDSLERVKQLDRMVKCLV